MSWLVAKIAQIGFFGCFGLTRGAHEDRGNFGRIHLRRFQIVFGIA